MSYLVRPEWPPLTKSANFVLRVRLVCWRWLELKVQSAKRITRSSSMPAVRSLLRRRIKDCSHCATSLQSLYQQGVDEIPMSYMYVLRSMPIYSTFPTPSGSIHRTHRFLVDRQSVVALSRCTDQRFLVSSLGSSLLGFPMWLITIIRVQGTSHLEI